MNDTAERIEQVRSRSFRQYPEYKDSGVEWLGEIPVYWEVKAAKRLFWVVNGATPKSGEPDNWDGEIPWVTPDDLGKIRQRVLSEPARYITPKGYESCGTSMVREASLILSTRAPIGHIAISGISVCTNQGCRSLVFRHSGNATYFYFQIYTARPVLEAAGQGSTFRELAKENLESFVLSVPPLEDQRAIAMFLDRETAKIDGLVKRKGRLIELLQEKRTALITRAITRGLDANAPMKDSCVQWLGEIPAHWEVKRLRWAIMFQRGHDLPSHEREEGDVPVVSSSGVSSKHSQAMACAPGIVTGRYGTIGNFYLITEDYWPLNTTLYSIDLRNNDPRFLWYMLGCLTSLFIVNAMKSAVPGVDRKDVHPIETAIPPPLEQRAIAAFLDRETAKIDSLITKIRQAVNHLKEFRTALISAAVTGKIDIREEAP